MSVVSPEQNSLRRAAKKKVFDFFFVLPERHHWRRYLLGGVVSALGIWVLAIAYYVLTPASYTSKWTFILPGSGAGVSVSLEGTGQATSQSASPFSSPTLSPKVIYREIATSDKVIAAAATAMGMPQRAFGAPRVKLIDETALILFEFAGRTPEVAKAKAEALIKAFMDELDFLRRDEIERRAASVRETLKSYRENLAISRQRIYDHQQESGIISVEQFNEIATSLEETRRKIRDLRSDVERIDAEQTTLMERVGLTPTVAITALQLAGDPLFFKAVGEYAEANTAVSAQANWIGPNNPIFRRDVARRDAALTALKRIAQKNSVEMSGDFQRVVNVFNMPARAELFKALVTGEAQADGKRRELAALEQAATEMEERVKTLNAKVARLEDLKKDHLLAEAVFTSAVARLDTNKADVFASYPLTQVLATPDLPQSKSAPLLIFAVAGGLAGTILSSAAWTLAWLRQLFVRRRRKKPSSVTA